MSHVAAFIAHARIRFQVRISRRSIAQGAAWAVPAVAVAGTAPAFAASLPELTCEQQETLLQQHAGSTIPRMTRSAIGTTYDGGATFTLSLGIMKVPAGQYQKH